MTSLQKKLTLAGVIIIALCTLVFIFRVPITIQTLSILTKSRLDVGPNQPVHWNQGPAERLGKKKTNIVVIMTDDMGFNDVSYHGAGLVPTPNIDALAFGGVRMLNGYAGSAVCSPSRAMLMTGRYATRYGYEFTPIPDAMAPIIQLMSSEDTMPRKFLVEEIDHSGHEHHNELTYDQKGLPSEEVTLAEELKKQGYHTVHIGKWHLGRSEKSLPNAQGFDESLLMESGLYLPVDSPDVVNSQNELAVLDKVQWKLFSYATSYNRGPQFEPKGYLTDYYTEQAVAAIEANKHRPFLLYLAHWGVHTPLQASKRDYDSLEGIIEDHTERVYGAMLIALDRSVGQVMNKLQEEGLADDTLVVFTSDNGGANYIGLDDINKPYRGFKLSFFEGGTHVPYIMHWPAKLEAGISYASPVSHLDIMPTALAAAGGVPSTDIIDGVNLLPYLTGKNTAQPHQQLVWRSGKYQAIMVDGWKLQRHEGLGTIQLYNLSLDPFESNDLVKDRLDKTRELIALLDAHNSEQVDPLWPSNNQVPVWIDKSVQDRDKPTLQDPYTYWPN